MDIKDLKAGKRYLLKESHCEPFEVTVLEVASTAIKFKYLSGSVVWKTFDSLKWHKVLEELSSSFCNTIQQ